MSANEVQLRVSDMDCPSCVRKIQARLEKMDGVLQVEGSPVARTLTIGFDPSRIDAGALREAVGRLGYSAHPLRDEGERAASTWGSGRA